MRLRAGLATVVTVVLGYSAPIMAQQVVGHLPPVVYSPPVYTQTAPPAPPVTAVPQAAAPPVTTVSPAQGALAEVNATRAARGLPPYIEDGNLTSGAVAAANYRAQHLMEGHTSNDFGFLPAGAQARAAGCAAWQPSMGWGACATYDTQYRYAGAGIAMGRDGRRYMHLFVR
jgi:hypothetical protein